MELLNKQLDGYGKMAQRGEEAFERTEHPVIIEKASDAILAQKSGYEGQLKVVSGIVTLDFIQLLIKIIIEEVEDRETISRIAVKLRQLGSEFLNVKQ